MTVESAPPQPSSAVDVLPGASRRQERARSGVLDKYKQEHEAVLHLINHDALAQEFTWLLTRASAPC